MGHTNEWFEIWDESDDLAFAAADALDTVIGEQCEALAPGLITSVRRDVPVGV